jgi:hypothetical protein
MTHVERSQVRREVSTGRGQALVVTLSPEGAWIREKGRRTAFLLPYGVAYQYAARMAVDAAKRERKDKRRAR